MAIRRMVLLTIFSLALGSVSFDAFAQKRKGTRRHRRCRSVVAKPKAIVPKTLSAGITTPSGLSYFIIRKGTGAQPITGQTVLVHYTGMLTNGVKFDSSRDRNEPISFPLGTGRVIKGWDEGIAKLHVGDQAILTIPPQIGYGEKGADHGVIPPNATLIFIVELVDIKADSNSPPEKVK